MNKIFSSKYNITLVCLPIGEEKAIYNCGDLSIYEILPTIHRWTGDYRLFNHELNDLLQSSCQIINLRLSLDCNNIVYGLLIERVDNQE